MQVEAKGWQDERLKVTVLQAVALHALGEKEKAVQVLGAALALAEPGGFIRTFVDEGEAMRFLISDFSPGTRLRGPLKIEKQVRDANNEQTRRLLDYSSKLLGAFKIPPAMTAKSEIINHESRNS